MSLANVHNKGENITFYWKVLLRLTFLCILTIQVGNDCYASSNSQQEHPKVLLGIINDSVIGSLGRGQEGKYLGPDDFLTVSSFLQVHYKTWRAAIIYNDITSRKYHYRYDLITTSLSREWEYKGLKIVPKIGMVWRDDFRGDDVQNWFHRLRGLPEVDFPYLSDGLGLVGSVVGSWETEVKSIKNGLFTSTLEVHLASDLIPSRVTPMLGYQTGFWNDKVQLELLAGARFYLNQIDNYSQFVRSGPIWGGNLKTRIYKDLYFDIGVALFSVQNLENDPAYADREFNYIPQIVSTISLNSAWYRFYNFLEY